MNTYFGIERLVSVHHMVNRIDFLSHTRKYTIFIIKIEDSILRFEFEFWFFYFLKFIGNSFNIYIHTIPSKIFIHSILITSYFL